jgi:hypothetical protein
MRGPCVAPDLATGAIMAEYIDKLDWRLFVLIQMRVSTLTKKTE